MHGTDERLKGNMLPLGQHAECPQIRTVGEPVQILWNKVPCICTSLVEVVDKVESEVVLDVPKYLAHVLGSVHGPVQREGLVCAEANGRVGQGIGGGGPMLAPEGVEDSGEASLGVGTATEAFCVEVPEGIIKARLVREIQSRVGPCIGPRIHGKTPPCPEEHQDQALERGGIRVRNPGIQESGKRLDVEFTATNVSLDPAGNTAETYCSTVSDARILRMQTWSSLESRSLCATHCVMALIQTLYSGS